VISTFNRREVLLRTLGELQQCGLDATRFEILVVDNASHDYTAKAIAEHFPQVRAFKLMRNRGSCAKNIAIGHARGQFIVFLDDDSYPMPGSMTRMLEHFAIDPDSKPPMPAEAGGPRGWMCGTIWSSRRAFSPRSGCRGSRSTG
jgi:glycosyltransferase involved in cell wall biosynthesis